jgi:hypothetical protein
VIPAPLRPVGRDKSGPYPLLFYGLPPRVGRDKSGPYPLLFYGLPPRVGRDNGYSQNNPDILIFAEGR